jgi:Fe2+ transport system protein FeoA
MTRLHQLRNGEYARLVEIDHDQAIKKRCESKGIIEGSIISVISSRWVVVFRIDSSVYVLSRHIAEHIRVIPLNTVEQ